MNPPPESDARRLLQQIRTERSWIRLLRPECLVAVLQIPCGDPCIRSRIGSELILRAWLVAGGSGWQACPERELFRQGWRSLALPNRLHKSLERWLETQCESRSYSLPTKWIDTGGNGLVQRLREDLRNWEMANGVITLLASGNPSELPNALVLPFLMERGGSRHHRVVRTANDDPLPGLCTGVERANAAAKRLEYIRREDYPTIILHTLPSAASIPFHGASAGLAVLVRHALDHHEAYEITPFTVAASGCLSPIGDLDIFLSEADIGRKASCLARVGAELVILPECANQVANVVYWPCAKNLKPFLDDLAEEVTPESAAMEAPIDMRTDARQSFDYMTEMPAPPASGGKVEETESRTDSEIADDLARTKRGMRYGSLPSFEARTDLVPLVEHLEQREDVRGRRLWVQAMALLASAECHLGNMPESTRICRKLLDKRAQIGRRLTAQTLIQQAVNLTDMAEYEQSNAFCLEALELAEELTDEVERLDLEMQAHGTRGQALMDWGLIDEAYREPANEALRDAEARARQLDSGDPGDQEQDLPRQLNYRFLWHALFSPESADAAFEDALAASGGDSQSRDFLMHIRWQAAYRAWLSGRPIDWRVFEHDLPAKNAAGGWLYCLARKYRGALRAAEGDTAGAMADFKAAVTLLEQEQGAPLLAFLGATAALQAGESLIKAAPDEAHRHLNAAADLFRRRKDWFPAHPEISGSAWLDRAARFLRDANFNRMPQPQLHYPY